MLTFQDDIEICKGEDLWRKGDRAQLVYRVTSGAISLEAEGIPYLVLGHGSVFGYGERKQRRTDAIALFDSYLQVTPIESFNLLLHQNPALGVSIITEEQVKLHSLRERLAISALKTKEEKVYAILVHIASKLQQNRLDSEWMELPFVTGRKIASLTSLSDDSVYKAIAALCAQGKLKRLGLKKYLVKRC